MNRRKEKILSYLLDNSIPVEDRLSVCYEIQNKFPETGEFFIISTLIKSLEENGRTPSLDHLQEEYDYDYEIGANKTTEIVDILDLIETEFKEYIQGEVNDEFLKILESGEKVDVQLFLQRIRSKVDEYDSRIKVKEKQTAKELYLESENTRRGLHSYVEPIDELIPEFALGTMSTLAGRTAQFKTTLALNMMYRNLIENKRNIVFVSLEMSREHLLYRLVSRHSFHKKFDQSIPLFRIIQRNLEPEEKEFLFDVVEPDLRQSEEYGDFVILKDDDFDGFNSSSLRSRLNRVNFEVDGIIIDYAQLFKNYPPPHRSYNSNPVNWYVKQFNELKDNVDGGGKKCHVMFLAQTNRKGYRYALQTSGCFELDAISEAHSLERNSDYVWFTFAPEELKNEGELKVLLKKSRYGREMADPVLVDIDPVTGICGDHRSIDKLQKEKEESGFDVDEFISEKQNDNPFL